MRVGVVHDPAEEKEHQDQLHGEPEERGEVEKERHIPFPQAVIDGQRGRHDRAIHLACRVHAEVGRIGEKARHIAQIPDEAVLDDGMGIVKVESVLKVVGVGRQDHQRKPQTENRGSALGKKHCFCERFRRSPTF